MNQHHESAEPSISTGKIMAFWQTFYSVGSFICFWVNYACTKNTAALGEWDWKLTVMFQLLVPVIILCLLPTIPGTPRWSVCRCLLIPVTPSGLTTYQVPQEEQQC